ncbi:MAG: class IV adenylate cyclase [Candidatus Hodarchaeales archaeon]
MSHINIEFKAKCPDESKLAKIRDFLLNNGADFKGEDNQVDTYFKVKKGRLKLREGNIESALIYYERENTKKPKQSDVTLHKVDHSQSKSLKNILSKVFDTLVVVDKKREIYFIENVKFHLDRVKNLGFFVEVEAIDIDGSIGTAKLHEQCTFYLKKFDIHENDLITVSYSDLILDN